MEGITNMNFEAMDIAAECEIHEGILRLRGDGDPDMGGYTFTIEEPGEDERVAIFGDYTYPKRTKAEWKVLTGEDLVLTDIVKRTNVTYEALIEVTVPLKGTDKGLRADDAVKGLGPSLEEVYATLLDAKEKMEAIGGTLRQVNLWRSSDQEYRQRIFGCGDTSFKDPFPESFEEFEARSLGRMKAMRKVIESYDFGAKVTDTSSWHIQRKDCYKVSVDLEAQVGNVATKTFGVTMQIHFKSRSDEVEKVEVS